MIERASLSRPRLARIAPWLIALAGFALDVAAFWPGQMSFDSAYAWWQARGGDTTNIAPPMFFFVWRALDAIVEGPGAMFALHLALFWSGLALIARGLALKPPRAFGVMAIVAFAPVSCILRAHVWTDVAMFSSLLFATGALLSAHVGGRRRWLVVALPALVYASGVRYNALPALLPLVAWFAWLACGRAVRSARTIATGVALAVALYGFAALVSASVQRRVPLWPATAEWDLAAISIASNEMRLPPFMVGPGMTIDELAGAFRDWNIVPMLQNTQHGMRDPFMEDFTPEQLATLRTAWLDAIRAHPAAWLGHHWRQAKALVGTHDADWPRELIYVDDELGYRDTPRVERNGSALHATLMRIAATLVPTPWLAAWPYLLAGIVAAPFAWRRRDAAGCMATIVLASAWLYLAPLLLLVPAELRYLGWCGVASVLAAAVAALAPRSARHERPAKLAFSTLRTPR
jgi:hypothetical protein